MAPEVEGKQMALALPEQFLISAQREEFPNIKKAGFKVMLSIL